MIQAAALLFLTTVSVLAQPPPIPSTGTYTFPAGRLEIHAEIRIPAGAHDLTILGQNTTLHAAADFHGRALLSCQDCQHVNIRNIAFDGNRAALEKPLPVAPTDVPFSRFFPDNGLLIENATALNLDHVDFSNIPNFAVIVSHSREVTLSHISVSKSGSLNALHRNNTSGGILLEEGTNDFVVGDSVLSNIRGNGVWTHSCYGSPRNLRGKFAKIDFSDIGRDAIQVGHASQVMVMGITGRRIGFPASEVDLEALGTPVGIDTAGNVDRSTYQYNRFEEVNGKCIDLDGFHDGAVRGNTCVNRGKPEDYPYGNFGIAFNNTSIDMQSRNVVVAHNTLDGMKFGGIFVVGSGHTIAHNIMRHLNTAHCNETHIRFGCIAILNEPGFLESGIYLAARGNKADPARNITIEDNAIAGWKMARYCVRAAPGVSLTDNRIQGNRCWDE